LSPSPKSFSPNSANSDTDCANKSNTEDENPLPKRNGNCPPDGNLLPPCRVGSAKASGLLYGANTSDPCIRFKCIVIHAKDIKYVLHI
jgi:hypothetical protein